MLGEQKKTNRGFGWITFEDAYGHKCSLQQSSAIGDREKDLDHPGSSFVWLGIDDAAPVIMKTKARALGLELPPGEVCGWMPYPVPEDVLFHTRMHLNRQQVADLVGRLNQWLATGEITDAVPMSETNEGPNNGK